MSSVMTVPKTDAAAGWTVRDLPVRDIATDAGTQMRPGLDLARVEEFAGLLAEGAILDPVRVVKTQGAYVLVDGFHRLAATDRIHAATIPALVKTGTIRDAMLEAVAANAIGSMPRCPQTKRRAVFALLEDEEWREKSTGWIARTAGVSFAFAEKMRAEYEATTGIARPDRVTGEDGKARPARAKPVEPAPSDDACTDPTDEPVEPDQDQDQDQAPDGDDPAPEPATTRASGSTDPAAAERAAERAAAQRWLESLPCRDQIPADRVNGFDQQALAYRELDRSPHFAAAMAAMRKQLGSKRITQDGPFTAWMAAVANHNHPRDWRMCLECTGVGAVGKSECRQCRGHGYLI